MPARTTPQRAPRQGGEGDQGRQLDVQYLLVLVLEGEVGQHGAEGRREQRQTAGLRAGQVAKQRLRCARQVLGELVGGFDGALVEWNKTIKNGANTRLYFGAAEDAQLTVQGS